MVLVHRILKEGLKGAIRQYCFVYIKPFNFMNDIDAISSYAAIGVTVKEVT